MTSPKSTGSLSEPSNDRASPAPTTETHNTAATTVDSHKEGSDEQETDEPKSKSTPDDCQPPPQTLRRSSRYTTKPSKLSSELEPAAPRGKKRLAPSKMTTDASRQNPKRKASESAKLRNGLQSDLVSEALRPLESEEIEEWEGWVELESEPAFFNIILRDLGVSNVKAQELFSVDEESIGFLPKPVFGLIFLFQYHPGLDETEEEDDPEGDLWFANQTTHNACATVSLLNILLNVSQVQLGPSLTSFKESTQPLSTALRGHRISTDPFIRRIHNSFTRRMDHLNTDLALENEFNAPKPKKARGGAKKGAKGGKAKKKAIEDFAFHFIGYVERDGYVWELDGLKTKPHKLGPVTTEDWTSVVRPQIEMRMCQYEESQLSFNLLALCQSPLANHRREIAEGIAALRHLKLVADLKEDVGDDWQPKESVISQADSPEYLAEFGLTPEAVLKAEIPMWARDKVSEVQTTEQATELHNALEIGAKATIGEYRAELIEMAQDEQRVKGRKKDYGPALHKWVSKLAEKGVLEDLISSTKS